LIAEQFSVVIVMIAWAPCQQSRRSVLDFRRGSLSDL